MSEAYVTNKRHDPYNPTYLWALTSENSEQYFNEMDEEIVQLVQGKTYSVVPRSSV